MMRSPQEVWAELHCARLAWREDMSRNNLDAVVRLYAELQQAKLAAGMAPGQPYVGAGQVSKAPISHKPPPVRLTELSDEEVDSIL